MHNILPKAFCFINSYDEKYIKTIPKNIDIIYRNYKKKINKNEIYKIKILCRKKNKKFFISNDIKIALNMNLDGIYIPSFNKDLKINYFSKKKNFYLLGSAHNIKEIRQKEMQNVDYIFLSPIFLTKKSKNYLGTYKFNSLVKQTNKKVICLGGIKKKNLNKIKLLNTYGFSSISLFKQNIRYIRL
tara:strand:+ start:1574 stop:2131 length:558 start_codon:yes stop_codon:yes gene_type:complete